MATPHVILAPTDGGDTSDNFDVGYCPVSVRLYGASAVIAGSETVTVEYQDAGGNWHTHTDVVSGSAVMAAGDSVLKIEQTGTYRAVKTATAAETGLEIMPCLFS